LTYNQTYSPTGTWLTPQQSVLVAAVREGERAKSDFA
jgi:hypothetical protein